MAKKRRLQDRLTWLLINKIHELGKEIDEVYAPFPEDRELARHVLHVVEDELFGAFANFKEEEADPSPPLT